MRHLAIACLLFGGLAGTALQVMAAEPGQLSQQQIIDELGAKLANTLDVKDITPVGDTGFYRLRLDDGNLVFTDRQAKGFLLGDVYALENGRLVNKSAQLLNNDRLTALQDVPLNDMIIFPADGKKIGDLYVFTDVDCTYCRRLHQEIALLQKGGVEVRYLAWPRCGPSPKCQAYSKMVKVWCAGDRQQAMTDAKNGRSLKPAACDNPIVEQYKLGVKFGLRGTPFLMLSNGTGIPGYKPAGELINFF